MEVAAEQTVKGYVFTLIEAHRCLQYEEAEVERVKQEAVSAKEDVIRCRAKKVDLEEIRFKLKDRVKDLQDNEALEAHLLKRIPEPTFVSTPDFAFDTTYFPRITVADMKWALEYLQEIDERVFKEIEELDTQHKKGIEGLEQTIKKYEEKLEKK